MTLWPDTIPLPMLEHSGQPGHATIASEMSSARIQRRNRFKSAVILLAVTWNLSLEEMDLFEEFFTDTLGNGAAKFEIELRHPLNSELAPWVCRFIGGYEADYMDGRWDVKAQLELSQTTLAVGAPLLGWVNFYVETDENDENDVPFGLVGDFVYCVKSS